MSPPDVNKVDYSISVTVIKHIVMKAKHLFLILFSLCAVKLSACPVWLVGKMKIVNEHGELLKATVWHYYDKDSFELKPGNRWAMDDEESNDAEYFEFWEGGGWYDDGEQSGKITDYYRLQVPGFADLVINSIDFNSEDEKIPTLVVVMYPKKFFKIDDKLSLIEQYVVTKPLNIAEDRELNLADYWENIQLRSDAVMAGDNESLLTVESYPNPVTHYILLKINAEIKQPYTLKISDIQGQLIKEVALTEKNNHCELEGLSRGAYIAMVYDPIGVPVFSRRFLKQ